jgi:uncharacterized protein
MQNKSLALVFKALAALVFAWACLIAGPAAFAQNSAGTQLQPVPELTGRVIDQSGTLSSSDVQSLSDQLKKLEDDTGAQVVVLMLPSTVPEDIAAYAWRVASSWKLGRKEIGDGTLIVVAKNDRRMRIEVARKLEGAIPDIMASRIIDEAMKPRFRADDYAGGLSAAIAQMSLLIHGEKLPAPQQQSQRPSKSLWQYADFLLPLLFFGFPIGIAIARAIFGRVLGSVVLAGLAGVAAYFITASIVVGIVAAFFGLMFTLLSNTSRGGGGGGPYISSGGGGGGWSSGSSGGGGGGFSSGGGGSFGGGGASGGW